MEINSINFYGNNGWENQTDYIYTPSSMLHIPRIGDTIKNKYGDSFIVDNVIWNIPSNSVDIICKLI